ncbi:SulP family inorganic anion transporter [Desulfosporosinus sp. PR]|uniref:SulP family inorganic anion transporter n=1 Tax=Candidatus Desulfosporosinus nitrosoreducens TaxID=3401928 RepID=UPI0027F8E04F|nr:SulP family inorganic anion transporter [Desulfosporosinus sp. PR]MDQ7097158.1 SulP family inorganic anion transporter [Desulfosporosinus sp. PR]
MSTVAIGRLLPFMEMMRGYKREYLKKDIIGALTVTVVGLPQYMAYALIAGVNPVYGLYTGIVAGILGSAFGCSNQLITGPTNAICLLTASAMIRYMKLPNAMEMLFLMTFMVGILQILYGVFRLGKIIDFVSHSVLVGFTAGAGIIIALGQVNGFLGISIPNSASMSTLEKTLYNITHITHTNPYVLGVGVATIAIIIICKKISKNLPGALLGIIIPIFFILAFALDKKGVKLTGTIPSSLPPFTMVKFSFASMKDMLSGAFAISIIGLVEAISISKAIGSNTRQEINSNQEFIGQGIANTIASFFQCFPSSGSFTRSAINYINGGVTRLSGILAGVFVAILLVLFAPYAKYIPSAGLAAVLIYTGYGLIDKKEFKKIVKMGMFTSDSIAMWVTCILVIVLPNLDNAIYAGIILSIILYLKDTNKAPFKLLVPAQNNDSQIVEREIKSVNENLDILIIQPEGNLYFGAAADFNDRLSRITNKSKVFIVRMKYVTKIDFTLITSLKVFARNVKEAGGTIIISGVSPELEVVLKKASLESDIGSENIFMAENEILASTTNALERARVVLAGAGGLKSAAQTVMDSVSGVNTTGVSPL